MRVSPIYNNFRMPNFTSKENIHNKINILDKYNIDISNVDVICDKDIVISPSKKSLLVEKIIEAHELAQKNYNWGNIAKSGYATNIGLSNGDWHCATNFNNTRNEISAICGERSAVLGAYNNLLKSKPIQNPDNEQLDFKVKYLAMSSYKPLGEDKNAASPCGDCLSWLNTNRYFDEDTIVASLEKDSSSSNFSLRLSKLKDYLPFKNEINSAKLLSFDELPIQFTKNAEISMLQKGLDIDKVRDIVKQTKKEYDSNLQTEISGHNIASGVLASGELFFAKKMDFSKRWYTEPLLFATSKAVEKYGDDLKIDAVCYVGDSIVKDKYGVAHNDGVVNLKSISAIRTRFAEPDTLIISNTKDAINVRTIEDYLPDKFKFVQAYNLRK